jgi:hypothetical protein
MLYIVKKFLYAHGSEILIQSSAGKGAAFIFDLEKGRPE